jgi:hypothetical protein
MIKNLLRSKTTITMAYSSAGIYKLTCSDCQKAYIGPTGRQIQIRYKEHIQSITLNKEDSKLHLYIYLTTNTFICMEQTVTKTDNITKDKL